MTIWILIGCIFGLAIVMPIIGTVIACLGWHVTWNLGKQTFEKATDEIIDKLEQSRNKKEGEQ